MKLEIKVKITKNVQLFCEYIGFFIGGMLGYMSFEGGSKGTKIVKKGFDFFIKNMTPM